MAWNLLDTLNSDLTKTNLFDGIDTAESNKKLTNQAAPIEKAQEIAPDPVQLNQDVGQAQVFNQRDSAGQRAKPDSKIGVFDSIPTEKETQFTEAAPIQKNITLGEVFDRGVRHIRDIEASFKANNYGKDGEKGENAAIHTAWKAAYLEKLSSTVEDKFGIPRDQVGSIFTTLAKTNGGFRTAREMDEIIKIQKEGVSFTGVDGEVTVGPDEPWEVALAAHKAKQTAALRGEKPVDAVKELGQITEQLSKLRDKDGNLIAGDGNEALNENLLARRDAVMKLPTGTSAFSTSFNRLNVEDNNLSYAESAGVGYKNLEPGEITARRLQINQDRVALAIQHAPTFGDKGEQLKYLTDPETKGLPFKETVNGIPTILFPTDKPNIYKQWSSSEKTWKIFDANKKEEAPNATEPVSDDKKYPTAAGKFGAGAAKSISETSGGVNDKVNDAFINQAVSLSNTGPFLYNAGVNVAEAVAGAAGTPIQLGRSPYYRYEDLKKKTEDLKGGLPKIQDPGFEGPLNLPAAVREWAPFSPKKKNK